MAIEEQFPINRLLELIEQESIEIQAAILPDRYATIEPNLLEAHKHFAIALRKGRLVRTGSVWTEKREN
jgi:hypothetical protein